MEKLISIATPRVEDQGNKKSSLGPRKTQESTDRLAQYLADTFKSPEYLPIFRKIAWSLDDGTVQRLAGSACEIASNPRAYFVTCAKNEMRKRGSI